MNDADASRCLATLESCRRLIGRLTPGIYEPDDVFQEVLIAADGSRTRSDSPPTDAWLRVVARNIAVRRHRAESVRQCPSLATDPPNKNALEPAAELERVERQNILRKAVDALKPKYRQVIERRFYADETFSEIASHLGIPEQTARTRYKRALQQLKQNRQLAQLAHSSIDG